MMFLENAIKSINKTVEKSETCRWKLVNQKDGEWHTECEERLNLPDLIEKYGFTKCPYCGKEMLVIVLDEDDDDTDIEDEDGEDGCSAAHAQREEEGL